MKKRTKSVLLALIAVVAIILVIALLRGCQNEPEKANESADEISEMPLDDSPLIQVDVSDASEEETEAEPKPNFDPESGIELEEDELPIITG